MEEKKPKLDSSNNYSWDVRKQGRGELDGCQFWDTPVQWSFKPNIFGKNEINDIYYYTCLHNNERLA